MFVAGARNILVPSPRPIQNLQRAFENYRITWITGVNTLYNALLNEEWFTAFPPRHLKAAGRRHRAMHHAVVERFEQVVGAPLVEGYGLTETSPGGVLPAAERPSARLHRHPGADDRRAPGRRRGRSRWRSASRAS
jgi:acyl-CoA synthetase (AMP-forming)/AMP-acid ligase II